MQNYQVLSRKYRPQNFSDVVGQDAIVTTLKNALRFKKIAHAYLFSGSRGTGKTTLARLFAKSLNCSNLKENQEPCNECPSCKEIVNGQSLDVIEIDGASNRGIDDIREINEMVGYVPSHGKYKIYIIDEVHMLTKEAFNALLKTLEEPPATAKFFFATTEPHKVLPTIISRCQRFDLGRISPSAIINKLEEIAKDLNRAVDREATFKIADMADGSLRDAESLFDQVLCFTENTVTAESVREIFGLVSSEHFFQLDVAFTEVRLAFAFELIDHLFQSGKDLSHFMTQLIEHYRLIALGKTLGESALPAAIAARYLEASKHYTKQQSLYLLEYLINSQMNLQKSLSPRIFLETVLLHIIRSKNRIPIEVIARRLSELEGKETEKSGAQIEPTRQRKVNSESINKDPLEIPTSQAQAPSPLEKSNAPMHEGTHPIQGEQTMQKEALTPSSESLPHASVETQATHAPDPSPLEKSNAPMQEGTNPIQGEQTMQKEALTPSSESLPHASVETQAAQAQAPSPLEKSNAPMQEGTHPIQGEQTMQKEALTPSSESLPHASVETQAAHAADPSPLEKSNAPMQEVAHPVDGEVLKPESTAPVEKEISTLNLKPKATDPSPLGSPMPLEEKDLAPQSEPPQVKESSSNLKQPSRAKQNPQQTALNPSDAPNSKGHQSQYDTLIRFAAVELEGSLKT